MRNTPLRIPVLLLSGLVAAAAGCVHEDPAAAGAEEAQHMVEKAREDIAAGRLMEAGRLLSQAVKANPENAEAWYERGRVSILTRLDPKTEGDTRVYGQRALDE